MRYRFAAGAALAAFLVVSPVHAVEIVDQYSLVFPVPATGFSTATGAMGNIQPVGFQALTNIHRGQTITAGARGRLNAIDLQLFRPTTSSLVGTSLRYTLFDGDYLSGSARAIGSQDFSFASLPTIGDIIGNPFLLQTFDTRAFNYRVRPGQTFTVLGQALVSGPNDWAGILGAVLFRATPTSPPVTITPNYPGGVAFLFSDQQPLVQSSFDSGFQTRVELLAGVPEPGSWAMMILGFFGAGSILRRRVRQLQSQ